MAKITIYSKVYCPYCVRAKDLFKRKNVEFEEIILDDQPERYAKLKAETGLMTVPQIFINEKLVGGYSDLASLDQSGELDRLLKN